MSDTRVGFVGLGSQGGPMAHQIIAAGFSTTLWARRPETLTPYASTPAQVATSLAGLGAASDVLCLCVVNDRDVDQVLRGADGALTAMQPGGVVVIHSTVHPDTCRRLAVDHPHLEFLDAPVSGGGDMAAARQLLVMAGGDAAVLDRCRPVLDTFADPIVHLGPLGAGQEAKLLNNALFTAHLGLAADLFAIGIARGLDGEALGQLMASGSGRSYGLTVVDGAGRSLDVMAQLAGPLLAKDVTILSQLLGPEPSRLMDTAHDTLRAMGLEPEDQ